MLRSISASNPLLRGFLLALGRLIPLALLCMLLAATGSAQQAKTNTNTATAVLHLQAFIVPVAHLPAVQQPISDGQLVNYNLPTPRQTMDVHIESRNISIPAQSQQETVTAEAELRTTVVVIP